MRSNLTPAVAAKAYIALAVGILIAGLTAWQAVAGDGMTGQDWVTVALAVLSPILVWAKSNTPADA
jgi:hypothetical protein